MISEVIFHPSAFKSWEKLDPRIQSKFAAKLKERVLEPENNKDRLSGRLNRCFKIRLIKEGYRLVYQPFEERGVLLVRSVGRRDSAVYSDALDSLNDS
uniref:type II toxin-antitoxin system RelE family toxin n=1 Tax=Aquiluna sp. TaxID=2053504 RepID=UPI0040486B91